MLTVSSGCIFISLILFIQSSEEGSSESETETPKETEKKQKQKAKVCHH